MGMVYVQMQYQINNFLKMVIERVIYGICPCCRDSMNSMTSMPRMLANS